MQYAQLGHTNLMVSTFCLGTMMFGGKTDAAEAIDVVRAAVDQGVNFIDTANTYTGGRSEEITGEAIAPVRNEVVLASKVGSRTGDKPNQGGLSRFNIVGGVEASLARLGTDRIDVLYIHWPEQQMNVEEMVRALEDLVRAGKVLYPACSNFPAWLVMRSLWAQDVLGCVPFAAGQYAYNLLERALEVELLPMAAELGVGIVCYRPLCAGYLTGRYSGGADAADGRLADDERRTAHAERYDAGVRGLVEWAQERGHSAAEAAIAWVAAHPAVTSALVGISRRDQLERNLAASEWQMTAEERAAAEALFPEVLYAGWSARFPELRRALQLRRP